MVAEMPEDLFQSVSEVTVGPNSIAGLQARSCTLAVEEAGAVP